MKTSSNYGRISSAGSFEIAIQSKGANIVKLKRALISGWSKQGNLLVKYNIYTFNL